MITEFKNSNHFNLLTFSGEVESTPRKSLQACEKIKKIGILGIDFHILGGKPTDIGVFNIFNHGSSFHATILNLF